VTQLLSELLSQSSLIISNVRDLSVASSDLQLQSDNMDPTEWLAFLRPFTAVETLRTCDRLGELLGTVLEDSTKLGDEVLPVLQSRILVPRQSLIKFCQFPTS
jgi:hypothetical protein